MKTQNNESILVRWDSELPQSTVYWMLIAIVAANAWTIYLTYYNSRVLGLIITAIINKLFKYGHIKLGSFSFSVLSGKVMFRDVHLITEDFSLRVEYGWLIFRWWRPYVYKELNEDGFEFHVYNRSAVYTRLEKLFGLEKEVTDPSPELAVPKKASIFQDIHWRDLIPVIKTDIQSGHLIFGNYLMPYSFLLKFEKADTVYTTKPASTAFDLFMHVLKCDMENVRLMLVPSPKYNGPVQDEPPRYMGDGFVVFMSNDVDVYVYMDEPGIVQHEPEQIQMADGEVLVKRTYPCVGVDIKCGKNTDINYGPWVDRQRELIWKFFYPPDYQPLIPTKEAEPGEKRQCRTMEVKLTINAVSTIDVLFTKYAITQAIHMNAGKGSYVEITIPYVNEDNGYTTKIKGQLMLIDATTSMSYRSLLECETLEFDVTAFYPRVWNASQEWRCDFTACKIVAYLIFDLKHFFSDLVDDWSSKSAPDIYSFVPYTWTINLLIKQFEILTLANENNWVDTSSQHQENTHVAFCGEVFDLCVTLPFTDFLPLTLPISLIIKGETVFCRLYLPENDTIRHALMAISENVKIVDREGNECQTPFKEKIDKQWRNVTKKSENWVDCWFTSYVFFTVTYTYYPMPVLLAQTNPLTHPSVSSSVPDEEMLLMDSRLSSNNSSSQGRKRESRFDPGVLDPDLIQVELEVAPSTLLLYGSLLRNLIHLKENYLGEFQKAVDFTDNPSKMRETEATYVHIDKDEEEAKMFDKRKYRPFSVTVSVTLHDIHAHLAKNCSIDGIPCPSVLVERLCFEMDKSFRETKLQLLLSPCVLLAKDNLPRTPDQEHLKDGHIALSGVQVRGHAMFSLEGLPLDSETLEYAWLIEATIGELTGKLTTPQVQNIAEFLQTFIMMIENAENKLQTSLPIKPCQHMIAQEDCPETKMLSFPCPNSEDIKYEMIRASVDYVNIFLVESGSALNVQAHPMKVAHCNLHGTNTRAGITGMVEKIELKQYLSCVSSKHNFHNWLEAGGLSLGPVMLEATMALPHPVMHQIQDTFLRVHDAKMRRLWFMWPEKETSGPPPHQSTAGKCGCLGGCAFFGKNKNGPTFFKLKRHRETGHGAIPHISKDGDPGFGQSLLHDGKLVFETSQLAIRLSPTKAFNGDRFAFTRGYMSELASPEGQDEEDNNAQGYPGVLTPSEDSQSKSTNPDTLSILPGTRADDASRFSRKSLSRQGSIPSPSSSKSVLRSSSKKGRKLKNHVGPSKVRGKARNRSSTSVQSESVPGMYHTLPQVTSYRQTRVTSKLSLDSEAYYTANESDSDAECITQSTTAWSTADMPSPTSIFDDEETSTGTLRHSLGSKSERYGSLDKSTEHTHSLTDSSEDSTLSFRSAPTDRDSDISNSDVDEDMVDMIDLHSHMNQPITESPLLLSCYSQHLSHYCCQDWSSTAPQTAVYSSGTQGLNSVQSEYSLSSAGHSVYSAGVAWMPQFTKVKEGFSVNVMKPKNESKASPSNVAADLFNVKATMDREHDQQSQENQDDDNTRDNISKTTAVVQLSGSLDILITPLLLESLQRYVEGVIPTLSKIHPSSLIDSLHSQCLDRLKQQNKLKKGKELDFDGKEESVDHLDSVRDVTLVKTSSLQALFTLPKINICVLQSSIVEEVIAFSNLGSVSDLTAVSLLAVCVDGIKCQLLANKHSCKVAIQAKAEPLTRKTSSTPNSSYKQSKGGSSGGRAKGETNFAEPDHERPQEINREENVGTLQISHLHIQLRRLLKYSNFSEHVLLTAIPEPCSRVLFTLEQDLLTPPFPSLQSLPSRSQGAAATASTTIHLEPNSAHGNLYASSTYPHPSPKRKISRTLSRDCDDPAKIFDSTPDQSNIGIGFIMCECGLEDISITTVRRLGYCEGQVDQMEQKMAGIDKTVLHMQEMARNKLDSDKGDRAQNEGEEAKGTRKEKEKEYESMGSSSEGPIPLSSPSCRLTSASMESSTWDSEKTFSSDSPRDFPPPEPCEGDASNGRLDLKTIWFNFASPPPISINKKVDFTRLDWNLLSTATPAIDAWLNPSDRLMTSVRQLVKAYSKRLCCVMACMMIEGLESSGIHVAYKSKFNKLTPLSKTLQEDPSNQLLTVLRKYLHRYGTVTVERAVAVETLPQLITVQKGILALMRQWKNMLYMPNLGQINFKTRRSIRPYNVSFALPKGEDEDETGDDNDDIVIEQFDVVDERMSLLQAEGGMTQRRGSAPSVGSKGRLSVSTQGKTDRTDGFDYVSAESFLSGKPSRLSGIFKHKKSAGAIDSPLERSTSNLAPPPLAGLNRNDSNLSFTSLIDSASSNEQIVTTPPQTPLRSAAPKQSILKNSLRYHKDEDLYQWMANKQGEFNLELDEDDQRCMKQHPVESYVGGLGSTWSQEDSRTDLIENDYTMATSIMQLADAQILFKPVLQSLGLHVESVRPSAMMKKFGGHLLLQGHLRTFKILIAESEEHPHIPPTVSSKGKGRGKRSFPKYLTETAAFQCESFDVNVSLKDVIDFNENGENSRFPYKFAMHKLEAKPSTLQINLLVNCRAVRQHVDMSLLRLAHQVLTMVGNVKETRVELKQKRSEHSSSWMQTHRKQASKDSSSSADTQQSDVSHRDRIFGSFQDILSLEKEKEDAEWHPRRDILPSSVAAGSSKSASKWSENLKTEASSPYTAPKGSSASAVFHPTARKSDKLTTDLGHVEHLHNAATGQPSQKQESKPRPQGLPLGQVKKLPHLRFAQDLKTNQPKEKGGASPFASNVLSQEGADVITPPQSLNLSDSVIIELADTSSPALNEKTIIDEIEESTPQCWKHLYQLLDLYATMPEPKTVARRHSQAVTKLPVIEEEDGGERDNSLKRESRVSDYGARLSTLIQNRKSSVLHGLRRDSSSANQDPERQSPTDLKKGGGDRAAMANKVDVTSKEEEALGTDSSLAHQSLIRTRFKQSIYVGESVPLIVFGILKIEKVLVSAELSGLSLEANTTRVHATGTYKKKVKGFHHRVSSDSSFTAHMGHSTIKLREGEPPDWQTVVTVDINKSQALLSSLMRRGKEHNSVLTSLGLVEIDIPQHPVALHGMMARSTKRITATLQELGWPTQSSSRVHFSPEANQNQSSGGTTAAGGTKTSKPHECFQNIAKMAVSRETKSSVTRHFHLKSVLQGIVIGASILPSLKAQYKTDAISATGVIGRKVQFTITLPKHLLSFRSKITAAAALADNPIPTSASIELPPIQIIADYRVKKTGCQPGGTLEMELNDGLEMVEGNYLYAVAEVGMLEHSLTTDLLNHLVFVQKVFMKEINEIVQKVSGSGTQMNDYPNNLETDVAPEKQLLYSVSVRFKGIQVTATTPTSNAVRFETGEISLELSNRFHLPKREINKGKTDDTKDEDPSGSQKMFIQAIIDLSLSLGQLLKNPVFEEAEPEFHTMAFFKTTVKIRNALQHEMIPNLSHDQEALLINLTRPIILAQPLAFDKAVLVWLNYKNAYEYWTEQRMALNKEVLTATRQVIDKLPQFSSATSPAMSTLFLQLTVDDMGICVPLISNPLHLMPGPGFQSPRVPEADQGSALVLTIESTQISACSSGSLVSKGKFKGFSVRFADDFGSSWDDWKPWPTDSGAVMNQCTVPSGTYEVCSRTINKQDTSGNAKWILNVQWDMKGIDVHLDTDIGKRFTLLGHTLTMLAGQSEDPYMNLTSQVKMSDDDDDDDEDKDIDDETSPSTPDTQGNSQEDLHTKRRTSLASDILPEDIFSDRFDPKERVRKIEQEMNEQAKIVQELKECGATEGTIETERKKLDDLQSLLFQDFRRDILEMLKRKGDRASLIKDNLGLSNRPTSHYRSKSTGGYKLMKHLSVDRSHMVGDTVRRQSEDLARPTKVSFSGTQLSTYTPPQSPTLDPFHESGSDREEDEGYAFGQKRSKSLEVITSSGSDSQTEYLEEVTPRLRKPNNRRQPTDDFSPFSPRDLSNKLAEQNIDFELDVKVFIDKGNCVLYPKEAKEEEFRKQAKRERQMAGDASPPSKRKMKREATAAPNVGGQRKISAQPETTVFFIPSVDVKVHYNSKTDNLSDSTMTEESFDQGNETLVAGATPTPPSSFVPEITISSPQRDGSPFVRTESDSVDSTSPRRSSHLKKASLYAWFSLQTLPEEMIISPTLLDFMEQALEPLPMTSGGGTSSILGRDMMDSLVNNMDLDASQGSLGQQSMSFFPVDVLVHIKVDPSFIRFNCHPVSRVECLLQVPSLDLFFSTKKTDINESMLADTTMTPKSGKTPQSCSGRTRHSSGISDAFFPGSSSGGLSVTGCMSDFSLYIFHPYGTGVQRRLGTPSDPAGFRGQGLGSISENSINAIHDLGRRDSLSLNVEYIRVNISRTRKLDRYSEPGDSPVKGDQQTRSNTVRFSAICDIGSASFKYDMRRLSEILSLPKAWYRRTLARRLFLGDESIHVNPGNEPGTPTSSTSSSQSQTPFVSSPNSMSHPSLNLLGIPSPLKKHHRRGSSGDKIRIQLSPEFKSEIASRRGLASSHMHHGDQPLREPIHRKKSRTLSSPDMQHRPSTTSLGTASLSSSWETLVLFAVQLSQLNLEVNMANVMGNTEWCTKELKSQGRLSINSNGHKNLNIEAGFDKSSFESKGGIVGGVIGIENLKGHFSVSEDPELGQDPDHQADLSVAGVEMKIDYMGSSIIMTRFSDLHLLLKDEWHVDTNASKDAPLATNRSAFLFVNGKLSWSHLHLMISRSTTPDLIKIISKLDEFFCQQVMSSRRVFQHTSLSFPPVTQHSKVPRKISESAMLNELRHHRHWQTALQHLLGCQFSMLPSVLPQEGMVLGGTMTLEGQGLMLASFHGVNFRAKYWALFNIKDPYIHFSTEAQRIPEGGTHIVQDLQFVVGQQGSQPTGVMSSQTADGLQNSVATISKISRTQHMPPNFTSLDEWFSYAMTSSVTDSEVVTEFCGRSKEEDLATSRKFSKVKAAHYSHDTEVIFAFPSMYMNLKTSHFQGDQVPDEGGERPTVECSFIAEFYDHIYVAMDAEVILFLHDLVSSYIREKDKGVGSRMSASLKSNKDSSKMEEKSKLTDPTSALKHDFRSFECKTWQLEPTLRLIHWASTKIDPVGADYVLQKLGFSKARVTIPKWVQRGFMDPLDKVLSVLVDKLITALRDQHTSGGDETIDLDASIGPTGSSGKD